MDTQYILKEYFENERSLPDLAKEFDTYPNKIRRIILKAGKALRNKSESQRIALESGRVEHPTKGKERDQKTKLKLSQAAAENWQKFTKKKKKEIKQKLSEAWKRRPAEEIAEMQKKAAIAVSQAGREGSKIEKYLLDKLPSMGYNILAHKKGLIPNTNLEPDIVVPDLMVVIEIDGPTHFFPIYGEEVFAKTQASDAEKNALFMQNGFCILRVKNICKTLTDYKKRKCLEEIVNTLEEIKKSHKTTIVEIEV